MKPTLTPTTLPEVLIVDAPVFQDERGFFKESYHQRDYAAAGLTTTFVQDNHSRSAANVVRGLHYQDASVPMGKLVRCTAGALFDVAVDIRAGSPTFGQWVGVELSAANHRQLWIPAGFAHGFAALAEGTEIQYKCTSFFTPAAEGVLLWNDPDIGIAWPITEPVLSKRDLSGQSLKDYLAQPAFHYTP